MHDRPEGDEHRARHALLEHVGDRLAGDVGPSPLAGQDVLQPVAVLHDERLVEVRVVLLDLLDLRLAHRPAREVAGGVGAPDAGEREDREGHDDEDQDELDQSLECVAHRSASARATRR